MTEVEALERITSSTEVLLFAESVSISDISSVMAYVLTKVLMHMPFFMGKIENLTYNIVKYGFERFGVYPARIGMSG